MIRTQSAACSRGGLSLAALVLILMGAAVIVCGCSGRDGGAVEPLRADADAGRSDVDVANKDDDDGDDDEGDVDDGEIGPDVTLLDLDPHTLGLPEGYLNGGYVYVDPESFICDCCGYVPLEIYLDLPDPIDPMALGAPEEGAPAGPPDTIPFVPPGHVEPSPETTTFEEETGLHGGERPQLEVEIAFSDESGETVTDGDGTHYHVWGMVFDEDKVYPSAYWGTFPLYFFGDEVGVAVTVRNNGPRRTARLRVRTEAYVLLTDGTSGVALADPQEVDVEVSLGESVTVDASFTAENRPGAESGLDRFVVKLLHPNGGGGGGGSGGGNDNPALIMMKEGVFCPPEYEPAPGGEGF